MKRRKFLRLIPVLVSSLEIIVFRLKTFLGFSCNMDGGFAALDAKAVSKISIFNEN